MTTSLKVLKQQVFARLQPERVDGTASILVEQAINDAHYYISLVNDFDELIVLDTSSAFTVISQKLYHLVDDLGLERPKDIYTVRYMDEANSRKLDFVPTRELDDRIPYTEISGTGRPKWYTRRGMYIELFRIPDAKKPLYIQHSQWPNLLEKDSDETPYLYLDAVIVSLAVDLALAGLQGGSNWVSRARDLLGLSITEEKVRPDVFYQAQPFSARVGGFTGEYWKNPWVKHQP